VLLTRHMLECNGVAAKPLGGVHVLTLASRSDLAMVWTLTVPLLWTLAGPCLLGQTCRNLLFSSWRDFWTGSEAVCNTWVCIAGVWGKLPTSHTI
jgi:hypothetical protein